MGRVPAIILAAFLTACAQQPTAPVGSAGEAPADFPESYYRQAAAQGMPVLRVDSATSVIVIEVYRGGSLARLGHDHVIASHEVRGLIAPRAQRADLYLRLDQLVVDEPDLRKQAGFDTQPSDEDIAGTRRNMLTSMEADAFPYALVRLAGSGADGRVRELEEKIDQTFDVTITAHGFARTVTAPVRLETRAGILVATGGVTLKQTDFGVTPLSVLGGAIQVKDEVTVRFAIRARALE